MDDEPLLPDSAPTDAAPPAPEPSAAAGAPAAPAASATPPAVPDTADAPPAGAEAAPTSALPPEPPPYFEAMVDGKPFQIPRNAQFPWKRGDETGHYTLEQIQRSPFLLEDYGRKTRELAEQRRVVEERDRVAARRDAELTARIESVRTDRQRLVEAAKQGGEAFQRELEHQQRLETDEDYRTRFEESEEFRISQRVAEYDAEQARTQATETVAGRVRSYIAEACAKHPGIDPARVEDRYSQALRTGGADLSADAVDAIVREEAAHVERLTVPLKGELDTLKQQVAALTAQLQASGHNAQTVAAIDRAKGSQAGRPANGAPPAPTRAIKPFNPVTDDADDWLRRWKAEGRQLSA